MPGHLNNSQLEQILFGRAEAGSRDGVGVGAGPGTGAAAETGQTGREAGQQQQVKKAEEEVTEEEGDVRSDESAPASPPSHSHNHSHRQPDSVPVSRYPLVKQLVVFVVRDLGRLCSYMPEHVRARLAEDGDSELRALTPQPGCVLDGSHAAFRLLIARLVRRLTGVALSPSAVLELVEQSAAMARHSLNMDTRTRRTYLHELYVPGADNVSLSSAVQQASGAFRAVQERSWFASGHNPLQRLSLTYPIQALQRVGRMECPSCTRKSHCSRTHTHIHIHTHTHTELADKGRTPCVTAASSLIRCAVLRCYNPL